MKRLFLVLMAVALAAECLAQGGPIKIKTFNAEGKMEFSRDFSINRK